jgi:hypothetical protein
MTEQTKSARGQKQRDRLARLKAALPPNQTVRVEPINDDIRRVLKHPRMGPFRASGPSEWPNDRFTKRRIAEGVIKVVGDKPPDKSRPRHSHHDSSAA